MTRNIGSCLLFYVKWPEPGKVKTRLSKHLGGDVAVELYRCFVRDMLNAIRKTELQLIICYSPSESETQFRDWLGEDYTYVPQRNGDLGDRLHHSLFSLSPLLLNFFVLHFFKRLNSYEFSLSPAQNWAKACSISISRGKSEGRPEGAKRPSAGDEPREFTSRAEGGRVPPFFEMLQRLLLKPPNIANHPGDFPP